MYTEPAAPLDPGAFHGRIYGGEICRFEGLPAMRALIAFTRDFLENALRPHHPTEIHLHVDHTGQIELFAATERQFSRSAEAKRLWTAVFDAIGLEPSGLACDRLYLRFQPHQDPAANLPRARPTATIAFHRDTWGSNLYAQTNWWGPVYPITSGRTVAMFPALWATPLRNSSDGFDMAAVLARSKTAGRYAVDADQAIPHLRETVDPALAVPVVIDPGSLIAFSGAHAHEGVPNATGVTRISLETRTLWIADVKAGRGAPNVDGYAPWMSPGLFRRLSDGAPLNDILGMSRLEPFAGPMPAGLCLVD